MCSCVDGFPSWAADNGDTLIRYQVKTGGRFHPACSWYLILMLEQSLHRYCLCSFPQSSVWSCSYLGSSFAMSFRPCYYYSLGGGFLSIRRLSFPTITDPRRSGRSLSPVWFLWLEFDEEHRPVKTHQGNAIPHGGPSLHVYYPMLINYFHWAYSWCLIAAESRG